MYCRNCGKELFESDNFCPECGKKVEKNTKEPEQKEIVFDPNTIPGTEERFDFNWDLEDFNRQRRKAEDTSEFDWGDLLGVKKEKSIDDKISEASHLPSHNYEPISDFVFNPSGDSGRQQTQPAHKFGSREDDFYTFSKKNAEFQELLNKEHERVRKAKEDRAIRLEELDLEGINKEIAIEPVDNEPAEEELTFLQKRRKRRESEKTEYVPAIHEMTVPLKADEDDIAGGWPEEPAPENKDEEQEISVKDKQSPVNQIEEMARARELLFSSTNTVEEQIEADAAEPATPEKSKIATQQISRDQFAEFLKKAEEQFGIDQSDKASEEYKDIEEIVQELPDADEVSEQEISDCEPAEEIQSCEQDTSDVESTETGEPEISETDGEQPEKQDGTEEVNNEEPKKKRGRRVREQTGEFHLGDFKDDNFWSNEVQDADDEEDTASGGGRAGTIVIIILAVILAFQIALMIIRFQFPESAAAEFIEPKITVIENWIRGIFS